MMDLETSIKVTNVLLLANAMSLDVNKPEDREKVLRHLSLLEARVASYESDGDD